jgi:hypothetical protein
MKTVHSVVELLFAIPLGLLSVPLLLTVFLIKAIRPVRTAQTVVVRMDNSPELNRHTG